MSILIESCNEYLYENLNTSLLESDSNEDKKSFIQKIKDFFKKIWDWIKNVFYKLIGKSKDKTKELEEKLKDSKEPTNSNTRAIFDAFYKYSKDDGIDFLEELVNKMDKSHYGYWQEMAEEIAEKREYYEKKEPVLKKQIKEWNIKLNNLNDLKEANKILDLAKNRVTIIEKKTADIVNKLYRTGDYETKYSITVFKQATMYTIRMYNDTIMNINSIINNTK